MPNFRLVFYEVNEITKDVRARSVESAIRTANRRRHSDGYWEGTDETTWGTNGPELVTDADGKTLYDAGTVHGMVDAALGTKYAKALKLAELMARMFKEGEKRDLGNGKTDEYSPYGNDEEIDALYELIITARDITGIKPDCLIEED